MKKTFQNKICKSQEKALERRIFLQKEINQVSKNYLSTFKINSNIKKLNQKSIFLEKLNLYSDILSFEKNCYKNFFSVIYYTENVQNNKKYLVLREFLSNFENQNKTFALVVEKDEENKNYLFFEEVLNLEIENLIINTKNYKEINLKELENLKKIFEND